MKQPPIVKKMKQRLAANSKVSLVDMKIALGDGSETPRLKDILETEVDEKYYLRQSTVEKIIKEVDFRERLVSIKIDKEQS